MKLLFSLFLLRNQLSHNITVPNSMSD